jgi:hypothetical protein
LSSGEQAAVAPQGASQEIDCARGRGDPVGTSEDAPARAMPFAMSAFQLVSILSSRAGRTRAARAPQSFAAIARAEPRISGARPALRYRSERLDERKCQCRPRSWGAIEAIVRSDDVKLVR